MSKCPRTLSNYRRGGFAEELWLNEYQPQYVTSALPPSDTI